MISNAELAANERAAHDEGAHDASRRKLKRLLDHVYGAPNGLRMQADFEALAAREMAGAKVLEIGCGTGWNGPRFRKLGAASVDGVDVSQALLDQGAAARERPGALLPARDPRAVSRRVRPDPRTAVLHHVNYQHVLRQLHDQTLKPGGAMIFMEPLGNGLLSRAYWRLGSRLHTPDERPFYGKDLAWLRRAFPGFQVLPYGYASFAMCPVSAALFRSPDNPLMRACDRIDARLARRPPSWRPASVAGIFVIRKPG